MSKVSQLKIRPLSDRIVVEPKELETKTAGGIVIPDTAAGNEKPGQGKVVAIGSGKQVDGKIQPLQVTVGDQILFGKYAGTAIKLDNKEYLVMREEDVIGVID